MHCPKLIRGPELQLSKSCSTELYSEQSVSVPAPLNANELHLSMPTCLLHAPLRRKEEEGEAPEEVQTLWLQQDVSEWLVCLYNVSLFVCVVTVTTMKLMANS